jgi:hypothetical protein
MPEKQPIDKEFERAWEQSSSLMSPGTVRQIAEFWFRQGFTAGQDAEMKLVSREREAILAPLNGAHDDPGRFSY